MNKAFKEGFESSFSLKPSHRIREKILQLSVEERICRNWQAVGEDLRASMTKFSKTLNHVKQTTK